MEEKKNWIKSRKEKKPAGGGSKKRAGKKEGLAWWQKLLAGLAVTVAAVLLVELFANLDCLRLSPEERGQRQISSEDITATGYEVTDQGYVYNGESGLLRIDLGGRYVDKLIYTYDYDGLLDMHVTVQYVNDFDKSEQKVFYDRNSAVLGRSVMNIGKRVEWIELYTDTNLLLETGVEYMDLESLPLTITGFSVENAFHWNPVRMLFVSAAGAAITAVIIWRDLFGKKLEYAFLLVSLAGGIVFLACMPASKVGWDEEIHFMRAYYLSLYPGGEETSAEFPELFTAGIKTWPLNLPQSAEEKEEMQAYFDENCSSGGEGAVVQSDSVGIYTTGYVVQALFLKVGRLLHMPFSMLYQFGRLGGLLLYSLMMALAIRILPAGKRILMAAGLMPTPIFIACCYSYDSVVTAFISVGLALILRQVMEKERKFSWKEYLAALACLIWGILPKAVYAPLVLTAFLIPASKFEENRKGKWMMRAGAAVVFLALMSTFVLPSLLSPGSFGDTRGGDVNVMEQMMNVLTQPFAYIKVLASSIWKTLPSFLFGEDAFRMLGHWGLAGFGTVTMMYFAAVVLTDGSGIVRPVLGKWQKVILAVFTAGTIVLVWTAFYLTYTEPGSSCIQGVQGRYFLPVLLPLCLLAGNRRIGLRITDRAQNLCIIGMSGFLLFAMVWSKILV